MVFDLENLNTDLMECKKYSENIMNEIADVLDKENLDYISDSSNTEIVIPNCEMSKDEVQNLIEDSLDIPKIVTAMLIMIKKTEKKNSVFIRLKRK